MDEYYETDPRFEIVEDTLIKCKGTFDNSVLSIGEYDGIRRIGCLAFKGNRSIRHLYIGKTVIDIGAEAFSCCPNLEKINVDEENPRYTSKDGSNCIIDKENNCLILGCSTTRMPCGISSIGPFAFCGQTKIREVNIPSSVLRIHPYAFDGCESLRELKMNDGLEEIGECSFKRCLSLETIYVRELLGY